MYECILWKTKNKKQSKPNQKKNPKDQNPKTSKLFFLYKGKCCQDVVEGYPSMMLEIMVVVVGEEGWVRARWEGEPLNQGCFCSVKMAFHSLESSSLSKCHTRWEPVITGCGCLVFFLDSFDFSWKVTFCTSLGCVQENSHSPLGTNSSDKWGVWVWTWGSCDWMLTGKQEEKDTLHSC